MQKLIPTIYFYVVSLIGLILLIVGIFADIHYIVNISSGGPYPLSYETEARCNVPVPASNQKQVSNTQDTQAYQLCLKSVEDDRNTTKRNDFEKAISYSLIGLIVFLIHFYYARKQR